MRRLVPLTSWRRVKRVVAFKRDLLTVDTICLSIEWEGGQIAVWEETEGWDALILGLGDWLPGMPEWDAWWSDVAYPAFETNYTVLWPRT